MKKIVLLALPAMALLSACSHTRTVTTSDGAVTVKDNGKGDAEIHVTGKNGTVDFSEGKPITDYPADTPLYDAKAVMDIKAEEKHSRTVTLQTSDSVDKISDFYKGQLDSKGWKVETSMTTPKMTMYTAKKENRELVVTIADGDDGKRAISQVVADK